MSAIRIYLDLPPRLAGETAPLYTARLGRPDGEILVTGSPQPFLAAARALLARGAIGRAELWDRERPFPRMSGEIAELAKWTVKEDRKGSPRFGRYVPFPVSRSGQGRPNGPSPVSECLETKSAEIRGLPA